MTNWNPHQEEAPNYRAYSASDLTKLQARRMAFAGTRRKGLYWDAGTYVGEAVLSRTVAGKAERFTARHQIILRD